MSHTIIGRAISNPMWVYEANYRLLRRLLPGVEQLSDSLRLLSRRDDAPLLVQVDEQCRYTTMLTVRKSFQVDSEAMPELMLSLRLYHDAAVVEVTAYQGCRRIPPRYAHQPNGRYQQDEKQQVNHLLHDLLHHLTQYGFRIS